ncbi:Gfo/Idh/MocA family protein [Wenyingzhuangia sp. IMCC45533]
MKKIHWGIVGVGNVCEVKSAPAMYKLNNSTLEIVMRRDAQKAKAYALKHHVENWTTDAEEVINNPNVNAVYIATPPKYHKQYALKVAKAGKACYIEKPMAITHEECLEITKAFKDKQLPLFVAYYRTCLPNFLKVKELLHQNTIGKVLHVKVDLTKPLDMKDENYDARNWRVNPKMAGDGYFYDLGSHQLNILEFLIGEIDYVQGIATNQSNIYESNDVVTANILFKNNVVANCFWAFNTGVQERIDSLEIHGSHGKIELACFNDSPIIVIDKNGKITSYNIPYPEHVQMPIINAINNDLLNNTNHTYSSGKVASRTQYWLEQISGLVQ